MCSFCSCNWCWHSAWESSVWQEMGGIYVLGCDCGEAGCWPLLCRVRLAGDTVIWDQFRQPHRPTRDYTQFGPFVFDAEQYRTAAMNIQTHIGKTYE